MAFPLNFLFPVGHKSGTYRKASQRLYFLPYNCFPDLWAQLYQSKSVLNQSTVKLQTAPSNWSLGSSVRLQSDIHFEEREFVPIGRRFRTTISFTLCRSHLNSLDISYTSSKILYTGSKILFTGILYPARFWQ